MRKILLGAALAAVCAMGMTAMAAETTTLPKGEYMPGVNNYQSDGTADSKTIIIYKVDTTDETAAITGDDIFYVDQADTETGTFGANVKALMKANPTAGTYKVAVDGGESTTFEISTGEEAVAGCIPTTSLEVGAAYEDAAGYCSVAFQIGDITYDELLGLQTIKSRVGDWVVATAISEVIGNWKAKTELPNVEATVNGLVQVDWVPVDKAEDFELYFTADAVSATEA